MKNVFSFTIKALFVFKIFKFLSWMFERIKGTIKFGQFTNYNMINRFLEKSYTVWGGETFFITRETITKNLPDPFLKNQNWV